MSNIIVAQFLYLDAIDPNKVLFLCSQFILRKSFGVGRGSIVRFGLWLGFMRPFGLLFQRPFVTIPLVTIYTIGTPSFS